MLKLLYLALSPLHPWPSYYSDWAMKITRLSLIQIPDINFWRKNAKQAILFGNKRKGAHNQGLQQLHLHICMASDI